MNPPTCDAIASLLQEAGRDILLPAFARPDKTGRGKGDGSLVTETDLTCQQHVQQQLAATWPDIAFLGEEMSHEEQAACLQAGGRFWCLDPLDGTSNFIAGFPGFALSLALMVDGQPQLACIVDPERDETFTAQQGEGAQLNGAALTTTADMALTEAVGYIDFKRLDERRRAIMVGPGHYRSQRNIGSCALEWAWLAAGRGQFIVHGGEKIWDFAAGSLIAAEAGCRVSDFEGRGLFDGVRASSPIAAAASEALHASLLQLLDT